MSDVETEAKTDDETPPDTEAETPPKAKAPRTFTTKDGKTVTIGSKVVKEVKESGQTLWDWLCGNVGDK